MERFRGGGADPIGVAVSVVSHGVVSKRRLRLTGCVLALAGSIVVLAPAGCMRSVLLPILVCCVSLFGVRVTHVGGGAAAEYDVDDAGGCVAVVLVVLPEMCWCALVWCDDAIRLGGVNRGGVVCLCSCRCDGEHAWDRVAHVALDSLWWQFGGMVCVER